MSFKYKSRNKRNKKGKVTRNIKKYSRRKYSNKKRVTIKRTKKFTNKNMRGGFLTRGQINTLKSLGYTITKKGNQFEVTGTPDNKLINTRLPRPLRKDGRFEIFTDYIRSLLNNSSVTIPEKLDDLALKYIAGCDLEINRTAERIIDDLLVDREANVSEIQNFQDRTKKLGSFIDTRDGIKELNGENGVKEVIFNELPRNRTKKVKASDDIVESEVSSIEKLTPRTLYKYIIIVENGQLKIYYSYARGLYHFSYIDYYVKKNYNENGRLRENADGFQTPATKLFFVKNTSIPNEIMLAMSFGNSQIKSDWFTLLKNFVSQDGKDRPIQNIYDFVLRPEYSNLVGIFGSPENIIAEIEKLENIFAYRDYLDEWNTVIMGEEISHSCLTYELGVMAAGEFCTDESGTIYYVDCWSGHFKTPKEYLNVSIQAFQQYGYNYLKNVANDHLAKSDRDTKCADRAGHQDNIHQLGPSVTLNLKRKDY